MKTIRFNLSEEHVAMLEGIAQEVGTTSLNKTAKELLIAVLEDDAVAQGMSPRDPREKVINVNFRGRHLNE